jgi:rare lipoprotein A
VALALRALPLLAVPAIALLSAVILSGCAHEGGGASGPSSGAAVPRAAPIETPGALKPDPRSEAERGYASWYGKSLAGHRTASGERFDPDKMTAAHRSLPFGTWVEVRRVEGGASVRVRITDRGPFGHDHRIIDLAKAAADKIGIVKTGVALVDVKVVEGP